MCPDTDSDQLLSAHFIPVASSGKLTGGTTGLQSCCMGLLTPELIAIHLALHWWLGVTAQDLTQLCVN